MEEDEYLNNDCLPINYRKLSQIELTYIPKTDIADGDD